MKIQEIYNYLNEISPFNTQESWDNSGILIGDSNNEVKDIFVCLEVTKDIINSATKDSLIISHHPLIFKPLNRIIFNEYPSNLIIMLIQKNISLIAMHTNFDLSHLNESFARDILGFENINKQNLICSINFEDKFNSLITMLNSKLKGSVLKITRSKDYIKNIAIICGAGLNAIEKIKDFDCIITGDVKYHDAMKLKSLGISVIDVGHYDSERHFAELIYKNLKNINYNAIILDSQNPFYFIKG
ncbi:Nif3-like dinuclear metal center hexameric protein [Helicobacter sp. MIT 14-3879]|uniref:Nif3-like dinuclear metal center hexameric protein n=1 Tax=Helicobacter sp. MIT 14-3879 TaxID=2040649 RepID=UPI0015F15F6F|nr:Nif3-like dinuclear metal center hexameric protein [Helicobacter sp. MIT 14-3879]